jgi:sugar phosphate isomerase/epimerase
MLADMTTRREFLRISAACLASISAGALSFQAASESRSYGVQLYTVRKEAESSLPRVLQQIRTIGYSEVETYWNVYTHPANELRAMILDAGLKVPSGHFDYDGFASKFDYAKELGVDFMVCPMLPKSMQNAVSDFQRAADQFNQWGERAKTMGMSLGFHNHNYEFRRMGQTTGFDTLVKRTDPDLVCFEMDCYWITQAGLDPVAMMRKLGRRVRLLHLKDRKPGFPASQQLDKSAEHFTEVGNGSIHWKSILAAAQRHQIGHMFVEQDESDRSPMESLRISYANLEKM